MQLVSFGDGSRWSSPAPIGLENELNQSKRIRSRRRPIAAFGVLSALLCTGATSPNGCQQQNTGDPFRGAEIGAVVGVAAVVAVVVVVAVNHDHHVLKGCVFSDGDGIKLKSTDSQTYKLEGDPTAIKVGERIKFHGSKVKKTKDSQGDQVFRVESIKKDYGPCRMPAS